MNSTKVSGIYQEGDDSTAAGAQFNPPGVYNQNRTITMCAIVTDTDGIGDIAGVYGDVYYPENIALGSSHVKLANQSGLGCGGFMQEDELNPLSKADGIELFCNKIKNNNNNLPTFNGSYNYEEICKADGELMKETAKVYCGDKDLSYEDPSGAYKVIAVAQDANSLTGTLQNSFTYLPLTAFQADFTSVIYGNVKLNTEKIVNGDLTWAPSNSTMPTVRNVGNTRMNLTVWQDAMGLGKTGGLWNVSYDARVGSTVAHQTYLPEVTTTLQDTLDLSEKDEVDFSIIVNKFPTSGSTNWTGNMTLGAVSAPHLTCVQPIHVTSGPLYYGPTGWGGWSCPANTTVIDNSLVVSGGDLAATYAWKPGATTGTFSWPQTGTNYVYGVGETGFIGQNDNDSGETIVFNFDCMPN
jgi:hypothetical protein